MATEAAKKHLTKPIMIHKMSDEESATDP